MEVHAVPGKLRRKKKVGAAAAPQMAKAIVKRHNPKIPLAKQIQDALIAEKTSSGADVGAGRSSVEEEGAEEDLKASTAQNKTKTELAFEQRQERIRMQRVREKAKTSHREKVERFNEEMGSKTEFNDIPKISWTK